MINYKELKQVLDKNLKIPYPSIPKLYPNPKYANLVYDSFGSSTGELTAITQYVYEHLTFKDKESLSKIMLNVAMQEMRHLDIVGEIIVALGSKPVYVNSKNNNWNSKYVNPKQEHIKDIMKDNIFAEDAAINGYRQLIRYTNNIYLKKVYERIILDEQTHKEIFKMIIMSV